MGACAGDFSGVGILSLLFPDKISLGHCTSRAQALCERAEASPGLPGSGSGSLICQRTTTYATIDFRDFSHGGANDFATRRTPSTLWSWLLVTREIMDTFWKYV